MLWTVAYPLTSALVLWFIFTQAFKVQPSKGNIPFIVWLLAGMAAWNFFADTLITVTGCISGNGYMLRKRSFNITLLPIIYTLSSFFSHCIFFSIVILFFIYYGVFPTWSWLQVFYYSAYIFAVAVGIGFFTSTLSVFIPDVQNLVNIFVQVFFWATPVFWSFSMLPERYASILALNPVAYMVEGYRSSLLGNEIFWDKPIYAILYWGFALTFLFLSYKFFQKMKHHLADIL